MLEMARWNTATYNVERLQTKGRKVTFPTFLMTETNSSGQNVSSPANTKPLSNICTTSAQRLRRWSNNVQMLYKCFVFTGSGVMMRTLSFWIDSERGGGHSRFLDAVVRHTLKRRIVTSGSYRLYPQHRSMGHVNGQVASTTGAYASGVLAPVDVWCWIAACFTEEAHYAVLHHFLVLGCHGNTWRIWKHTINTRLY